VVESRYLFAGIVIGLLACAAAALLLRERPARVDGELTVAGVADGG